MKSRLCSDVGVRLAHDLDRGLDEARHDQLLGAEQVGVADGPAQDAAQHVAATLVRREHAVVDEHRPRAGVLGQDPQAEAVAVVVVAGEVLRAGERARLVDDRRQQVGLPHRVDALDQGEDALEAGAGIDRRLRQRRAGAVGRLVVLHEHQVPELHEPVAVGVVQRARRRARTPAPRSMWISEHGPHGPVSPICQKLSLSPRRWMRSIGTPTCSCQIASASSSLSWTVIQSRSPSKPNALGDEFPRPRDGLGLEVVAEAEVAQHLEEHEVALGAADVVEVVVLAAGPSALLDGGGPLVRGASSPVKYGLNGTMPATVNSTVGSCGIRLADGTTWWPRSAKKPVNAFGAARWRCGWATTWPPTAYWRWLASALTGAVPLGRGRSARTSS